MSKKFQKGFGVAEVLIASMIIAVILAALVAIGQYTLKATQNAESRLQATYLAQEGLEVVRQMRDSNWIDNLRETDWNYFVYNPASSVWSAPVAAMEYGINFNTSKAQFYFDNGASVELQIGTNPTKFYRRIKITTDGDLGTMLQKNNAADPDLRKYALKAEVEVRIGEDADTAKKITMSELMTDWRPKY